MNYANHDRTDLQHFCVYFFTYIKISKDLSGKYYQNNKKRLQNKLVKDIKVFLKKKNKKQQYGRELYKKSTRR